MKPACESNTKERRKGSGIETNLTESVLLHVYGARPATLI